MGTEMHGGTQTMRAFPLVIEGHACHGIGDGMLACPIGVAARVEPPWEVFRFSSVTDPLPLYFLLLQSRRKMKMGPQRDRLLYNEKTALLFQVMMNGEEGDGIRLTFFSEWGEGAGAEWGKLYSQSTDPLDSNYHDPCYAQSKLDEYKDDDDEGKGGDELEATAR